jgi:hypothetical protein
MTPWDLIAKLIEEATGMTGDQAVDKIRVERGAEYIRQFKREYPLFSSFVDLLIDGTPQQALQSLAAFNSQAARLPFALDFLRELQKRLEPNSR